MFIFIIIVALIALSAFFSLSETAITAASRGKIYKMKMEGDKRAEKVIKLLDRKDRLITTILLGNTAVIMASSSLATTFMMNTFGVTEGGAADDTSEIVFFVTALMTIVVLIFSEVLPKVFALKNPEGMALLSSPVISFLVQIFLPITAIVEFIVGLFLKILRLENAGMEGVVHGLDALRGAVELYHKEGNVVKEDKDMLGGIIDLDNTEVSLVMKHRKDIQSLDVNLSSAEIVQEAIKSNYSRIPMYSGSPENIIGILHTKSLMKQLAEGASCDITTGKPLVDIKSLLIEPWFVPDSTSLKEQLIAFREKRQHFALVVDEYGSLMGIVTLEDILEEIVGNIEDEYDIDYHLVEDNHDGSFLIDGTMPVRDLNREMNWALPTDIANTVAGLIINEAQMIPAKEQTFNFYGFRFEIMKKKRNQITKIKVSKVKPVV